MDSGLGARAVTRAKKLMSALMRGQGSVLSWPIPSFGGAVASLVVVVVEGRARIGVVATMSVMGGFGGGILVADGGLVEEGKKWAGGERERGCWRVRD